MEASEKWVKLYPESTLAACGSASGCTRKHRRRKKSASTMPLSYTPQYKNLMTRKAEFPSEYAAAKKNSDPCEHSRRTAKKYLSRMMEMVDSQNGRKITVSLTACPMEFEKF